MEALLGLLLSTLRVSTPLIFAAMGGLLSERSGVVHLGLEGFLLIGAFSGASAAAIYHSPWIGLLFAIGTTSVFALIYAIFVVKLKSDQIVAGTAMNFLAFGLTPLLTKNLFDSGGATPSLEMTDRFGSELMVFAFLCVAIISLALKYTRGGLWLQFAGEHPEALSTSGISVVRTRITAVVLSGVLAGIGGASLSLFLSSSFSKGMTAGRGFMALAALIFGKWRPVPTLIACLFFGLTDALQIRLQGVPLFGGGPLPVQFIQILPYIVTVLVLAGFIGKSKAPEALGRPLLIIAAMTGLVGCTRLQKPAPVVSPVPTTTAQIKKLAQLAQGEAAFYANEIFSVLYVESTGPSAEARQGLLSSLLQGASVEGIYRGTLLSLDFANEIKESKTATDADRARINSVIPNAPVFAKSVAAAGTLAELSKVLAEKELKDFYLAKDKVNHYVERMGRYAQLVGSDWGQHARSITDPAAHRRFAEKLYQDREEKLASDQLLWEILNRSHRVLNRSVEKK